ncbi:hypothetical protein L345_13361 [Ophiophagus hannah]|uniref:Uncharacterized protein n=1 Tax=Ophiophagus hannah TaxID=8665 RepID=V8NF51_OPHHA|nr:hypothetical protein L345_13361 [Ophiophagus hannah]
MQNNRAELLHNQALQPLQWQRNHREVRVTVRSSAIQPTAYAPPRPLLRKTLVAMDIVCLLVEDFSICCGNYITSIHPSRGPHQSGPRLGWSRQLLSKVKSSEIAF